jgi:hypothetical protein
MILPRPPAALTLNHRLAAPFYHQLIIRSAVPD